VPRLPHQPPDNGPHEPAQLADELIPIATQLVATVRDYGPADVAAVLAQVPHGRYDALAVVLAGMVDPDRTPAELLAWSLGGPVPSREGPTPPHLYVTEVNKAALGRRAERRAEVARLSALRLSSSEIAERLGITQRAVIRHRTALRRLAEQAGSTDLGRAV
jgi:DNA-binding NarL/FixJ family response regulator